MGTDYQQGTDVASAILTEALLASKSRPWPTDAVAFISRAPTALETGGKSESKRRQ